jgi:hypothetical protein
MRALGSLKPMSVGYNLVERRLIGREYEEIDERLSIVEFLRRLKRGEGVSKFVAVTGFEELIMGEDVALYVRGILSRAADKLRTTVIQLPIDGELVLDMEPKIKTRGREVRLTLIFGNRITPRAPGYFYSPPNI